MNWETAALLDAFESLPAAEKRAFANEILRRSLPFDSGPLKDEEIGAASTLDLTRALPPVSRESEEAEKL